MQTPLPQSPRTLIPNLVVLVLGIVGATSLSAADKPAKKLPAFPDVTELIPANACMAIAVGNLHELKTKGDAFITKTKANVPIRPSQLFAMALAGIGINGGLEEKGSAAVILANLKDLGHKTSTWKAIEEGIVIVAPFADLGKMAANFGIPPKDFQGGKIIRRDPKAQRWMGTCFAVRGHHILIGNTEKAIRSVLGAKPLRDELTKSQRADFAKTEVLFHIGTKAWADDWDTVLKEIEKGTHLQKGTPEAALVRELGGAFKSLKFGLIGMRLEEGLVFNTLMQFENDKTAREVLRRIAGNAGNAKLNGLPVGDVVSAIAINGPKSASVPVAEALIATAMRHFISVKKFVSVANQPAFIGVFGEVWNRLKGSRMAMYRNGQPETHGPYSLVAILDTVDANKFLADMRQLAIFVNRAGMKISKTKGKGIDEATVRKLVRQLGDDDFLVRSSAMTKLKLIGAPAMPYLEEAVKSSNDLETVTRAKRLKGIVLASRVARRKDVINKDLLTKLKPKFIYFPKTETRKGVNVDIVQLKLAAADESATATLHAMFGADWDKVRIATVGKQAIVLLGTNTDLFDEAIVNVTKKREGLAGHASFKKFRKLRDTASKAEFHLSITRAEAAIAPKPKAAKINKKDALSALSLSAADDYLRVDIRLSLPDVAVVLKSLF